VETGEDVIRFYGKYGHDSPVKFFYCNRWGTAATELEQRVPGTAGLGAAAARRPPVQQRRQQSGSG
jgi:hypothetical protein